MTIAERGIPLREAGRSLRVALDRLRTDIGRGIGQWPLAQARPGEVAGVALVLLACVLTHSWNLFSFPRYQGDEGVYISSAWSLIHGQLSPYTYNYGHPPLGWALIALWCRLTGGFFTFGTAINTGRVFMVVLAAISALLVYLIARRVTQSIWPALLATAIVTFSPLSVLYQRQVLIDNIATLWMLLALYLLLVSKSRLRYIAASAMAYGIAVLSKETAVVFFPVFTYGAWVSISGFQRRYLLIIFGYISLGLISTLVLLAILKNELFPTGSLLGGNNPHVSLIATYMSQAARGNNGGSFLDQWFAWIRDDGVLMLVGLASVIGNLTLNRRNLTLRIYALAPIIYMLFLARGGVTLAYYIIPVIPFLALNTAFFAESALRRLSTVRWWAQHADVVMAAPIILLLILSLPYALRANSTNFTADETDPQVAAMQWMGEHIPRSATIIANHYFWLDMHTIGGEGSGYGVPFSQIQMYWEAATDPAITDGVFHDDWNNVDYVIADSDMISDVERFDMPLISDALAHATAIQTFANNRYWVTIYQVQHKGPAADNNQLLVNQVNALPGVGATTAIPNSPSASTTRTTSTTTSTVAAIAAAPSASCTRSDTAQAPPANTPTQGSAQVTVSGLNIRTGPNVSYPIQSVARRGDVFPVYDQRNGWIQTNFQGCTAWIAGWYTSVTS